MSKQTFTTGQVLTSAEMTQLQANDYNQTVSAKVASYTLVASDAGTRITMANVAATTITVNTALFTAGDTLEILNIGAGVLTITAGTATVSTSSVLTLQQYDGGLLYFTSTGVAIYLAYDAADSTSAAAGTLTGATLASNVTASSLTSFGTSPALTTPTISTLTTNGDLVYGTGSGVLARKAIGSTGQVLTVAGGIPSWATPSGGGKVLQVVSATTSTTVSSSTTTQVDTGLTATITPTLNTSKILVLVSQMGVSKSAGNAFNGVNLWLNRAGSDIAQLAEYGLSTNTAIVLYGSFTYSYLDSPATTSATIYKTRFNNPNNTASVSVQANASEKSSIVLLEIGA